MKKFFLLFAVVLAIGCGDNSVEPKVYNPLDISGSFTFRFLDNATGTYSDNLIPVFLKVDSTTMIIDSLSNWDESDINMIENYGKYIGKSVNQDFEGICNLDSVKITVSMKLNGNRFEGFFKRDYPSGLTRTRNFYAGANM
ncbi:MAG: hypothetical protein V4642_07195 [Bacteroidota bacterium]